MDVRAEMTNNEIKFELIKEECRPYIIVQIGFLSINTLIDSGAEHSYIFASDNNLSDLIHMKILWDTENEVEFNGVASHYSQKGKRYNINELHIGNLLLSNVSVIRQDIDEDEGKYFQLVLGYNVLKHFNYFIDNENRTINFKYINNSFRYADKSDLYHTLTEFVKTNDDEYLLQSNTLIDLNSLKKIEYKKYINKDAGIKDQYEQLSIQYGFQNDPDSYLSVYRKLQEKAFKKDKKQ